MKILSRLKNSFKNKAVKYVSEEDLQELESILIEADFGPRLAKRFCDELKGKQLKEDMVLKDALFEWMGHWLKALEKPFDLKGERPFALFVGVNGSGKTTTIGKLATMLKNKGKNPLMVPADTFRAAAIEQLTIWGKRSNIAVSESSIGEDPASVVYKAIDKAEKEGHDCLLIDTAGRLHNKTHLMDQLAKIKKVVGKRFENEPQEVILVFDAASGQSAFSQLAAFQECVNVTGIIVTKLDGTARGGILIALSEKYNIPVYFLGVGEGVNDLIPFNSYDYLSGIFEKNI